MNPIAAFLIRTLYMTATGALVTMLSFPLMAPQAHAVEERVESEPMSVRLPSSGRLPRESIGEYNNLGVEFSGIRTSFGCDGLSLDGAFGNLTSQIEMIIDYYSSNGEALAMQALIATQPQLFQLLNSKIAQFQSYAKGLMAGCTEARKIGASFAEGAYAKCIAENGNTVACNEKNQINQYAADMLEEERAALDDMISKLEVDSDSLYSNDEPECQDWAPHPSGYRCEDTGDPGEIDDELKATIAGTYGMSAGAMRLFDQTVPDFGSSDNPNDPSSLLETKKRTAKLHRFVNESREEYIERLGNMVAAWEAGDRDRLDSLMHDIARTEHQTPIDFNKLELLARLRNKSLPEGASRMSADQLERALKPTPYGQVVSRMADAASIGQARGWINEIRGAVHNAKSSGSIAKLLNKADGADKAILSSLDTLEAELDQAQSASQAEDRINEIMREVSLYLNESGR